MSTATIRRAQPADAQPIIAGINVICAEGGAFYVTHFTPDEQWDKALYQPASVPDHFLAVAVVGEQVVGNINLFPALHHPFSQHVVELGMYVLAPYRRQGLGTQLLIQALAWATVTGYEKVILGVFATNLPAQRLYHKFHFVQEGVQRQQIKQGHHYIDRVLMARFLSP